MGFHLNPLKQGKRSNASEIQVRDNVPITITDWWQVSATIKEKIWSNMKEKKSSFQQV
jgi:hypothetical protein